MENKIYTYKGKKYRIFAESKMKVNGVWKDCVIYQTLYYNEDGWIWVKSSEEFFKEFKEFNDSDIIEVICKDSNDFKEFLLKCKNKRYYTEIHRTNDLCSIMLDEIIETDKAKENPEYNNI